MPTQIGKAHIRTLAGGTLAMAGVAGYVSPNLQSLRLVHGAEVDRTKGQTTGDTEAVSYSDEYLECTFDFVPEAGDTVANAKKSASLPALGTAVTVSGLPVITVGDFADALNTAGAAPSSNPWIYEGQGQLNGVGDGNSKWSATITLRKYRRISSVTVLS